MTKKLECSCDDCVSACRSRPGWFIPSQIPKLLKHFKAKNLADLILNYNIAIDWYDNDNGRDVYVLSPNIKSNSGQPKYPKWPAGTCVFLKNNKCSIHTVKPYECAKMHHADEKYVFKKRKASIVKKWKTSKILNKVLGPRGGLKI